MRKIKFDKYHGNGNDFIIIDSRNNNIYKEFLKYKIFKINNLCDRNFGIGADGLIFILNPTYENDAKMIIYNSDGSEAQMCGNGIRCMIEYLNEKNKVITNKCVYKIETKAGLKIGNYNSGRISVKMGRPLFDSNEIPTNITNSKNGIIYSNFTYKDFSFTGYAVGMGNPHLIFFVDNLDIISHKELGAVFEKSILFPDKTNVHFCQIIDSSNIKVKVWERGAGSTLACGTGACAIHVAANKLGLCESITNVKLPGGNLIIDWSKDNDEVKMTGTAKKIFNGLFYLN